MNLADSFKRQFKVEPTSEFFAPGRLNLIGEHIDYSGGLVLPCAITMGTSALVSEREDNKVLFYSENMPELNIIEVDLNDLEYKKSDKWTNYTKGIFKLLQDDGYKFETGLNVLYHGNIPYASGLSSSASILMVTAILVNDLYNLNIDRLDLVKLTQRVENEYIGVSTGIMDQFSIGFGKEANAILLNTNTLDYEYIPLDLGDNVIVIMNTNKKRGLADSAYNERRAECDRALELLQDKYDVKYLCDLKLEDIEENKELLSEGNIYKRAYHAVSENERTLKAGKVLSEGNLEEFGKLMVLSHKSLQHDYEVTGVELDTLVETALENEGVLGARVTGAGFGGCAIAIVDKEQAEAFIENVSKVYLDKIGYEADFYIAEAGAGARRIK